MCQGAEHEQVHVTGECEAITGFDRVKSFGGLDDVLFRFQLRCDNRILNRRVLLKRLQEA